MKKLTKIKLINWHLFANQTIEIKGNTLVSGENGSGKTTLLDALQYLFVGGRSGAKFNIAATDDAKRTLEGYIRGNIGAINKEALRKGDVISHIALEFFDERQEVFSIIGAIIDLPYGGILKERFYLINDLAITEDLFLEGKKPRDFKNIKNYFKEINRPLEPFESQRKYRDALSAFFGMDAKKYASILPKALSFKPIDLQAFVFDFLLDDEPIDVKSLKNNVSELKRIELQIRSDKEKLAKLEQIMGLNEIIINSKEKLSINQIIDAINFSTKREDIILKSEKEITRLNQKIDALREEKTVLDSQNDDYDRQILELEKSKDNNDLNRTISSYKEAFRKKEDEYSLQKETIKEIEESIKKEIELLKKIAVHYKNPAFDQLINYYQVNSEIDYDELTTLLSKVSGVVSANIEKINSDKKQSDNTINSLSFQIRNYKLELADLKRNSKTYPGHVFSLINALNTQLSKQYSKEINIKPLCELIEVNDEKWRNALEGYLGNQRFDLVVDPAYFNDSLEIYENLKTKQEIYGVGLVNTSKIKEYEEINENSLASKIDTNHFYARKYINMLIGNLVCVDDLHDLKNYNRSISKTCMTYSNHTARQINPRIYQTPYIGLTATKLQTDLRAQELAKLEDQMDLLVVAANKSDFLFRLFKESRATSLVNSHKIKTFNLIEQTRKDLKQLTEQLEVLGGNPKLEQINFQIDSLREEKQQLKVKIELIVSEIATSRALKQSASDKIDDIKAKLESYRQKEDELTKMHPEMLFLAKKEYETLRTKTNDNFDQITSFISASDVSLNNIITKEENEISHLMKQFNKDYSFGANPNYQEIFLYEEEAQLIRGNNLVKYEEEAVELRKNSEISFKEEFVNKLRASIETASLQIAELNLALKDKTFGTDSYNLVVKSSVDPDFKPYYEIIMGSEDLERTLFTEGLSRKEEIILMELFEKISSNDPQYDKLTYAYLDYRNYMSYDIEITNTNGNKSFFSRVSKEKSGGETQVPFYIVIAASFQQLLSHNKRIDSGCVVLFDEAFNKMDGDRINAMMNFYNSLSIQLIIAIPPEKVPNIIKHVSTSLAVVKDNDFAIVESFKEERV